jgi:23S rRNA (adenine2503-C2)-methyltransferase
MTNKKKLLGMTIEELKQVASNISLPAYASKQLSDWIYKKKAKSIDEMTNISAKNREHLSSLYEIGATAHSQAQRSKDGTIKYLFEVAGGNKYIESVYIPAKDRATLCLSSQIGCRMGCLFCMTGKQGLNGQLTSNEIINQIQSIPESDKLTNIVFMGMGEPLDNINELFKSLEILTSPYGYAWSPKRITVSTIGLIPGLKRFLEESKCNLAISLHSPYHEERLSIMPVEKAYPVDDVLKLLSEYDFSHQRRVSFEYIMFNNFNDSPKHAKDLAFLLKGLDCRVNLISYHTIPEVRFTNSEPSKMIVFQDILNKKGITCTLRESRGEDIFAACGMLSTLQKNT